MAFFNKISKCFGAAFRIENRLCIVSTGRNVRFAEGRLYGTIFKESKNDLVKAGRYYVTETVSNAVIKDQSTADDIKERTDSNSEPTNGNKEAKQPSNQDLSSALAEADQLVRRYGRLSFSEVENILSKCRPGMTSTEAVMLIKCTGQLLRREGVERRRGLFERVLKKVNQCCPIKTTEIMNAQMAIQIENQVDFDPAESLATFEELKLDASKHTFHLLLSQYCEQGNIDKALEILNHMKASDWLISASTIHNILKAYTKKGQKEDCLKMMQEMSQHGLKPTADTYTCLLEAHSANADVDAIKLVMREMIDRKIALSLRQAYAVVLVMVQYGHQGRVSEVMDILGLTDGTARGERLWRENRVLSRVVGQQRFVDFQDTSNMVFQLLSSKDYHTAVLILQSFSDQLYNLDNDENNVVLKLFISQLIKDSIPLDQLYSLREQLVQSKLLMREWEPLLYYVIRLQSPEYVLRMLQDLSSQAVQLKVHYLWSLFHRSVKKNKPDEVLKLTEFMVGHFDAAEIATSLYHWSFVPLVEMKKGDYKEVLEEFKNIGVARGLRDMMELNHVVTHGLFGEALKLVEGTAEVHMRMVKGGMADGVVSDNYEASDFFKFMQALTLRMHRPTRFLGQCLITCLRRVAEVGQADKLDQFVNQWVDADIRVDEAFSDVILKFLSSKKLPSSTIQRVATIVEGDRRMGVFDSPLTSDLRAVGLVNNVTSFKRVNKTQPQHDHVDVAEAKKFLKEKKYRDFRTHVHEVSERPDLQVMQLMEKNIKLPPSLINFFNRKLMVAHLNSDKQGVMMGRVTTDNISTFISTAVLNKIAAKDAAMMDQISTMLRENADTMETTSAHISLYHYYLGAAEVDKARDVMQWKPAIKGLVRLGPLSYKARQEKNEGLIRSLIDLHRDSEQPLRLSSCHNNLILLKCETDDVTGAEESYKEALNDGIPFQHLSIRCLQVLQSLLQSNNKELPWKEGELEKRIEEASKKESSSSSDSD